jgi:hypothetical protein
VRGIRRGKIRPWDSWLISIRAESGQVGRTSGAFVTCMRSRIRSFASYAGCPGPRAAHCPALPLGASRPPCRPSGIGSAPVVPVAGLRGIQDQSRLGLPRATVRAEVLMWPVARHICLSNLSH